MLPLSTVRSSLVGSFLCLAAPLFADTPKTILVLDGSNSMWGQIEGEAKITIARTVIADLLDRFPPDQALGLSAYGHNREGDCSDIEQLVPPTVGSADAIREAVAKITPRGRTPLSAAVIAAARELRSEEEPATVILISDGIETCDLDPCAVGTELERTGVDFTTHVIGFDLAAPEERAQLACLAQNTGGQFLPASNASELATALEAVAESPAPPPAAPERTDLVVTVTDGENGPAIQRGLLWTLTPSDPDGTSLDSFEIGTLRMSVVPGKYEVTVVWPAEDHATTATINVLAEGSNRFVLVMQSNLPAATVEAVGQAEAGTYVLVDWTGPDENLDFISVAEPGSEGREARNQVRTQQGTPVRLQMPAAPGTYEVRYVRYNGRETLASRAIEVVEGDVAVEAVAEASAGTSIAIEWRGPDSDLDFISVARPESDGREWINQTRTSEGSPLRLQMPAEAGTYEVRYVLYNERAVLASAEVEIVPSEVSVSGPAEAEAGTSIPVDWIGPDENLDFVSVAEADMAGGEAVNLVRTSEGTPVQLQMPAEAGSYELRYVLYNGRTVLATAPITVTAPQVSLTGPSEAEAGTSILVDWTGPAANLDFVSVAEIGSAGGQAINQVRVSDGAPLELQMPAEAGEYELRYVLYNGRVVLASQPVTVTQSTASVSAPAEGIGGTYAAVTWTGPEANLDFIDIAPIGADGGSGLNPVRVDQGSPLRLQMPTEPGAYQVRYVLYTGRAVLASAPIAVLPPEVTLSAPSTASAGQSLVVEWTGPDADLDFIAIAEVGHPGGRSLESVRTQQGSPLTLNAPETPGTYELRYVLYNGREVLARQSLRVE